MNVEKRRELKPDFTRFIEAQADTYKAALQEIRKGRKETHWMWWVFPQYKGLGQSELSKHYAIQSKAEAKAYLAHPILGRRLLECMNALLDLKTNNAVEVFGEIDAQKLKSCMTLFFNIGNVVCGKVLDKFFPRELDYATVRLLLKE